MFHVEYNVPPQVNPQPPPGPHLPPLPGGPASWPVHHPPPPAPPPPAFPAHGLGWPPQWPPPALFPASSAAPPPAAWPGLAAPWPGLAAPWPAPGAVLLGPFTDSQPPDFSPVPHLTTLPAHVMSPEPRWGLLPVGPRPPRRRARHRRTTTPTDSELADPHPAHSYPTLEAEEEDLQARGPHSQKDMPGVPKPAKAVRLEDDADEEALVIPVELTKLIDACDRVPARLSAKLALVEPLSPAQLEFQAYWLARRKEMPELPTIRIQLRQAEVQVYCWPDVEQVPNVSSYVKSHAKMLGVLCGHGPKVWKRILCTGDMDFNPGSMTLVLGPPGSGKTTFLKALAGSLHTNSLYHVNGVYYNRDEAIASPFFGDHSFAFVDGEDIHLPKLTVRQTVEFACECKRRGDAGDHTDVILQALGLAHVAKSLVGNEVIRGISGGEKRRLSIAEVWTSNLRVFLGDRISDGLDSATTLDLVRSLRVWCRAMDATVVVSLLQPPPEAFGYFDQVVVVTQGQVTFYGTPQQGKDVLAHIGSEVPATLTPTTVTNKKLAGLQPTSTAPPPPQLRPRRYGRRFPARLWLCMKRQLLLELDPGNVATKVLLNVITGLMTGSLWTGLPLDPLGLFEHDALLFHICVSCVLATQGHTSQFLDLKPIFYKQNRSGFYCTASFWIATTIYQLGWGLVESGLYVAPVYFVCSCNKTFNNFLVVWMAAYLLNLVCALLFRGCAIIWSSPGPANTTGGLLQVFLFLFSGFLITWSDLPPWWKWMVWLSPQSYAFSIMLQTEYDGLVIPCSDDYGCWLSSGNAYILRRGVTIDVTQTFIGLMVFVPAVWLLLGVLLWTIKAQSRAPTVEKAQLSAADHQLLLSADPIVLTWHDLTYCVPEQRGVALLQKLRKRPPPPMKTLLNCVSGISRPGSMTALMGPSGAGKTTLLDVLAGRKAAGPTAGEIRLNGHPKVHRTFLRVSGYVEQFDSHCAKYTVLESLQFSALMRLGTGMPREGRREYCEAVAAALHLLPLLRLPVYQLAADQRKYLGVAVELVGNPSILFLDEPTTGVDGLRAYRLMADVLAICRRAGIAVICTIHQPSAPLFDLFSHLVLLCKGGELAYVGPTGEGSGTLIAYLQGIPTVAPLKGSGNPAHWMLDEVGGGSQPDPEKQRCIVAHFANSDVRRALQWELDHYNAPLVPDLVFAERFAATRAQQFKHLLLRASRVYWRSPEYTLVRSVMLLIFSIIFGTSFWRLSYDANGFFLRMSLCYTTTFYCGLTYLVSAMTVLMSQRAVFYREKSAGMYSPSMYGLAYMLAEVPYFTLNGVVFVLILWPLSSLAEDFLHVVLHFIPFWLFLCMCTFLGHTLAAVSPTNEVAFAVGPGIACWFSSLAGFYLSPSSIPIGYKWVYWLNPFQYTFDSMATNMLHNRILNCTANVTNGTSLEINNTTNTSNGLDCIFITSDKFLLYWGLRPTTLWYWMDQLVVIAYILAWIVGAFLALRFLQFSKR